MTHATALLFALASAFPSGPSPRGRGVGEGSLEPPLVPGAAIAASSRPPRETKEEPTLAQLEKDHRFFELRDAVAKRKGNDADTLYYRGLTRCRFGDYKGAERDLSEFTRRFPEQKQRVAKAHLIRSDVHIHFGRYREAVQVLDQALNGPPEALDAEGREDALNSRTLWNSIADVPPQTVTAKQNSTLKIKRTIGLRIPVTVGEREVDFIFDTGANLSCLSATMAKQLGVQVRSDIIQVQSISGKKVPARMGEIPEFQLGNATVRHAIALVFEDKDVTIPNTTFRLDAILGFPVIAGLRQFSITRDGNLEIPARPGPRKGTDLCLDGLTPLVQATTFGKTGTYAFDTGADRTDLWPAFFRDHETEIRAKGSESKEPVTGVGGTRHLSAWRLPTVTLTVAGREVRLLSPRILTEVMNDHSKSLHGNLGQDLVRQFDRVTLNFERMTLALD